VEFDFLGFTSDDCTFETTGQARWHCGRQRRASSAWSKRLMALTPSANLEETTKMVGELTGALAGWAKYFSDGSFIPSLFARLR